MALLLPKSAFIHCPKTAGSAVRDALRDAGYSCRKEDETGNPLMPFNRRAHARPAECREELSGRFTFTFIRDPVAWYRSYWAHRTWTSWTLPQYPEERAAWGDGKPFAEWVSAITTHHPGFLARIYREYTSEVDFVGHSEHLQVDLHRALLLAGEDVVDVSVPVSNASRIALPDVSNKLKAMICESEQYAVRAMGAREPADVAAC